MNKRHDLDAASHIRFEEIILHLGADMTVEGLAKALSQAEAELATMERDQDEAMERCEQDELVRSVLADLGGECSPRELAAECLARGIFNEQDRDALLEIEAVRATVAFLRRSLDERRDARPS